MLACHACHNGPHTSLQHGRVCQLGRTLSEDWVGFMELIYELDLQNALWGRCSPLKGIP